MIHHMKGLNNSEPLLYSKTGETDAKTYEAIHIDNEYDCEHLISNIHYIN